MKLMLLILLASVCTCAGAFAATTAPLPDGVKPLGLTQGVYAHQTGVDHLARDLAARLYEAASAQCQFLQHRPARIISGRLEDAGKWTEHSYYTDSKSATYTVSTQIRPVTSRNMCDFHEVLSKAVHIASFDGRRTRLIDYLPDKSEATSHYVVGQRLFTNINPDKLNGGGAGDFIPTGAHDNVAGFPCNIMRTRLGPSEQEVCVIDSVQAPIYVRQMMLRVTLTISGRPQSDGQVDLFIPEALVDVGVFSVPDSVSLVEKP